MSAKRVSFWVMGVVFLHVASIASAQFAVVDVGAITQLVQQLQSMRQQLETARQQLTQARQTLDSMRGGRGMERLLEGTVRNYLPPSWQELEAAVVSASVQYQQLSSEIDAVLRRNAILEPEVLARLSPRDRLEVERVRQSIAMHQVTARSALSASSQRFDSLQQLINAIPAATDQKAVLDLQARIAAEQGMLVNEQIKLFVMAQAAEAEERARKQRLREEAMRAIGSMRSLRPIGL
ncbi:type IV secretion system protein [Povalibacter sp.]|uniref:type IV secretion system protein n=1 Tax=Povalibacter sp. TaxID=1962978 RepID=UPI002F3F3AA8